jgi:hypothetical protein
MGCNTKHTPKVSIPNICTITRLYSFNYYYRLVYVYIYVAEPFVVRQRWESTLMLVISIITSSLRRGVTNEEINIHTEPYTQSHTHRAIHTEPSSEICVYVAGTYAHDVESIVNSQSMVNSQLSVYGQ